MKRLKLPLVILAMTVGLLALGPALQRPYARYAAEHLRQQLDTVSDRDAPVLLGRAVALGEPGIPVLAEALGSPRESVARAARRMLLDELDGWERLPAWEAKNVSRRLAVLADALAERIDRFGPTAQADASRLTARIVDWPLDSTVVDRLHVIDCCETVFRTAASAQEGQVASPATDDRGDEPGALLGLDPPTHETERLVTGTIGLPGGGLPIDRLPTDRLPGRETPREEGQSPRMAATAPRPPGILPRLPRAARLDPPGPTEHSRLDGSDIRSLPRSPEATGRRSQTGVSPIGHLSVADPVATRLPDRRDIEAASAETIVLMKRLRSRDAQATAAARDELHRRGFTEAHVELAYRLFDPDPRARKELVRVVADMHRIDATPWLLTLCRDADADVRLEAITLLATCGVPELVKQVEELARCDQDPRIRRQAERLVRQRRAY